MPAFWGRFGRLHQRHDEPPEACLQENGSDVNCITSSSFRMSKAEGMAVSVGQYQTRTSKDHGWSCVGSVREVLGGPLILLHAAEHDQKQKVKARLALIVPDTDRIRVKDLQLGTKLDHAFIDKAARVATTPDGTLIAMTGIRKKTGGFLVIWGCKGPKRAVVHQELLSTHGPSVLGCNKMERPQGVFIASEGHTVLLVAHDHTSLVWRRTHASADEWRGVWLRLTPQQLPMQLPPARFDAVFPTSCDFLFTTASIAPVAAAGKPFKAFSDISSAPLEPGLKGSSRFVDKRDSQGAGARRMCLVIKHVACAVSGLAGKPWQVTPHDVHQREFATPLPEDTGPTRDIPAMKWDSEGNLLAVLLKFQRAHVCFMIPGYAPSHVVVLPSEMSECCGLVWVTDFFVACCDTRGNVCLVSRLGGVTSVVAAQKISTHMTVALPTGLGSLACGLPFNPTATTITVSNGSKFVDMQIDVTESKILQTLHEYKRPSWLRDAPSFIRSLGSLPSVLPHRTPTIEAELVAMFTEYYGDHKGNVRECAKGLVQLYRDSVMALQWVVCVFRLTAGEYVARISRQLTTLLIQHLCAKLQQRKPPAKDVLDLLDAAFHAIKWYEQKLSALSEQSLTNMKTNTTLITPQWCLEDHWVALHQYITRALVTIDDEHRQPLVILGDVVLTIVRPEHPLVQQDEHSEAVMAAHKTFLRSEIRGQLKTEKGSGSQQYVDSKKNDCAFTARILHADTHLADGCTEQLKHAFSIAKKVIADCIVPWERESTADVQLFHAPSLPNIIETESSRMCQALAGLVSGVLDGTHPAVLPPLFCEVKGDLVVQEAARTSGMQHVPLQASTLEHLKQYILTSCNSMVSALGAELWLAYGRPLEALHVAISQNLLDTAERIMLLLNWQLSYQASWEQWLGATKLPCAHSSSTDKGEQMEIYEACRVHVKDAMKEDEPSKVWMQAAASATCVRGGWVCASCVSSLMSFFTLRAIQEGHPDRAQHLLGGGIATDEVRQIAGSRLTMLARKLISQLPPFDVTMQSLAGHESPSVFMHLVFKGNGKPDHDVLEAIKDDPAIKQQPGTLLRKAAKLLAWALIFLFPASTPAKCSIEVLSAAKVYRDCVDEQEGVSNPLTSQLRKTLRYAWLLQIWYKLHSRPRCDMPILSIPLTWSTTQPDVVEATLSEEGAHYVTKLTSWSGDVWETDVIQGAILSSLELCDPTAEHVGEALSRSFYEGSNRDSIFTIAQSRKGQYNRIARALGDARSDVVDKQKEHYDRLVEYDTASDNTVPNVPPRVKMCEGSSLDASLCWLHELDDDYWTFVTSVLDQGTVVGAEPAARGPPTAGHVQLVVLGELLEQALPHSDVTPFVMPYGRKPGGELVRVKDAPMSQGRADVATPPPPKTPQKERRAETPHDTAHTPATNASVGSIVKSTAGQHLPLLASRQQSPPGSPVRRPVDLSLPYELLPVAHGGLLLDVEDSPSHTAYSSPRQSPTAAKVHRILDDPSRALYPSSSRPRDFAPQSLSPDRRSVVERGWRERPPHNITTPTAARIHTAHPVADSATTKTSESSSGTTYTQSATTVTSTQAPVSSATTSIPDPIDVVRALSPYRDPKKERKERRREKERSGGGGGGGGAGRHDNRGVTQVHYHYREEYNQGETRGVEEKARREKKHHGHHHGHHVCKKHRREERHDRHQHRSSSRKKKAPIEDLMLNTNHPQTAVVADAMHRASNAAARAHGPGSALGLGLLRPPTNLQGNLPPGPPMPPQPMLLRPHYSPSPALPPKTSAPLSQHFALPKAATPLTPPAPSLYGGSVPKQASSVFPIPSAATPLQASPGPPSDHHRPASVHDTASVAISPMHLPEMSPRTASPSPRSVGLDPRTPAQVALGEGGNPAVDIATSPHQAHLTPAEALLAPNASPHKVVEEIQRTPLGASVPSPFPVEQPAVAAPTVQRPREDISTLVGQPTLSATEELLYAKYMQHLGITAADAVITGGVPLVAFKAASPEHVPSSIRDINDMHEARDRVGQEAQRAPAVPRQLAQVREETGDVMRTVVPSERQKAEEEEEEGASKRQASLDQLLDTMMDKQAVAAASAGKELATAFSNTLKNLAPGVARSMETSAQEGRKMEHDGMMKFVEEEGTYLQALARQRMVRPEQPDATGYTAKQPRDAEYEQWKEAQRTAAKKPSTADAALDPLERTGTAMQTILTPDPATPAAAYLAVRDLSPQTHAAPPPTLDAELEAIIHKTPHGDGPDRVTSDLLAIMPEQQSRQFLNVADTNIDAPETYSLHKEFDTRTWAVQSGIARLDRDVRSTGKRADTVEQTIWEASQVVQSCDAVLRDAQRLKQQRETQACLDVLKEDAERIERRLTAEARPQPPGLSSTLGAPSVYSTHSNTGGHSPAQVSLAREASVPSVHSPQDFLATTSTSSFAPRTSGHRLEGAQNSQLHRLQNIVEEGASGREPFLWENSSQAPVQRMQARAQQQQQHHSPPAVRLSSETAPLTGHLRREPSSSSSYHAHAPQLQQQRSVLRGAREAEVEVSRAEALQQGYVREWSEPAPVTQKEIEIVRMSSKVSRTQTGLSQVSSQTLGGRGGAKSLRSASGVSRQSSKKSASAGVGGGGARQPLGVVRVNSTSGRSAAGSHASSSLKRQSRRNPDVPLSLQREIDDLDRMLTEV